MQKSGQSEADDNKCAVLLFGRKVGSTFMT
jgi:hypothetical protein